MNIKDVADLALLARLDLSEEEKQAMLKDIRGILEYVRQIESVKVPPTKHDYILRNIWREDKVVAREFGKELITKQFPDSQNGYLKVKKIL
jgi:aspartyl-tRNA(Asn)/glutamyl-tRNA(Gln) amidotransferase subunit C